MQHCMEFHCPNVEVFSVLGFSVGSDLIALIGLFGSLALVLTVLFQAFRDGRLK